ncbi:unnamed protein product [Vitrella brassicaformis CCMP3155]|uniref:Uncharacterized protein n=2 Tax=Vitrella brassicaformis TaxID=1169539 RepID=A0A0G4F0U0_VITBC|nr:unnamed protein product [Vitrella brassicaformis CCMP3155]|eukprot:CEM05137.1 unnamed protein product [Vitrella brassicaformis CCMP3155]
MQSFTTCPSSGTLSDVAESFDSHRTAQEAPASGDDDNVVAGGEGRGLGRFLWRVGERVVDNMTFAGEVLVSFFGLDQHPYQDIIDEAKKREKEERQRQRRLRQEALQRETEEISQLEEAQASASASAAEGHPGQGAAAEDGGGLGMGRGWVSRAEASVRDTVRFESIE